jgi:hypothetical protein
MQTFEKLGSFYLGRLLDPETGERVDEAPVLYDAKDLTTHGICVGMTGSGKTGLCLSLIEEAAMDGIPVLAIDPKGDLGNLLLQFPNLAPDDFEPWIDPAEAVRKGKDVKTYAAEVAARWKAGLEEWGQDGERIRRLQEQADFCLYTPGSQAGRPLTILRSFHAPNSVVREDPELLAERVDASVSGLLALLGIAADPLQSREHILLANLFRHHWEKGEDLDLPAILTGLQNPPFSRVGFFDLESFFPSKDRMALAMRLNNLLASPGFQVWMQGDGLDIPSLLTAPSGKPKVSILSIAHLDENERMFFVTMLLNEIVAWMRSQPGTSSLRALVYMDEIFGFFPPTANPPSKRPMLTLLKQARAYGVGVMLATQNPVDLDYKGLSNTGTWFIGRLQTERDKLRVLDGLEGASGGKAFDRSAMEKTLSGLGQRRFLLHNVHENEPVVFETRWAMSYLRGPLTREQIRRLPQSQSEAAPVAPSTPVPVSEILVTEPPKTVEAAPMATMLPDQVPAVYLAPTRPGPVRGYRGFLLIKARLHYVRVSKDVDHWQDVCVAAPFPEGRRRLQWSAMQTFLPDTVLLPEMPFEAPLEALPAAAMNAKNFAVWSKESKQVLFEKFPLTLLVCDPLKLSSEAGETREAFQGRVSLAVREKRDQDVEQLKARYETKFMTLRNQIRRAEDRLEKADSQHGQRKLDTALRFGTTLLGAVLGRKKVSATNMRSAGTAMRSAGRLGKSKDDIQRAKDEISAREEQLRELEATFENEMKRLENEYSKKSDQIEELPLGFRKSDFRHLFVGVVWLPY